MGSRTKITFLARQDFANVSTEIARALRTSTETHDARLVSLSRHPYDYSLAHDYDLDRATPAELEEACAFLDASDLIVWAEEATIFADEFSAYGSRNLLESLLGTNTKKRRLVFHAGCAFRGSASYYDVLDREFFDGQLCSPDLLRLANADARCVWAKPMTTDLEEVDRLWKARRAYEKIVVTHSPSSHALKGTAIFRRVMARVTRERPNVEYREIGGPLGQHMDNAALMAERDAAVLCLDQYCPPIGSAGIVAYEAMSRGTIPLASTNHVTDAAYRQWSLSRADYPVVPLTFDGMECATEEQAESALTHIMLEVTKYPLEELEAFGRAAAAWTSEHLSPAPFAQQWLAQIEAMEKEGPLARIGGTEIAPRADGARAGGQIAAA